MARGEVILSEAVEAQLFESNVKLQGLGALYSRVRPQHSRVNARHQGLIKKGVLLVLRNSPSPVTKGLR